MAKKANSRSSRATTLFKIKNQSWGKSRSYLFEYAFMLLLIGVIDWVLFSMSGSIIKSTNSGVDSISGELGMSVVLLSTMIVVLPLLVVLIQRTAESERENIAIKNLSWRKAFLGIFLTFACIATVVSAVYLANSVLSPVSSIGLGAYSFDWRTSLNGLIALLIFGLTAWVLGNDYRFVRGEGRSASRHYFRYGIILTSFIFTALFILLPMREQRNVYVDDVIVRDLQKIQLGVGEYQGRNSSLPRSLDDINLNNDELKRADKYNYQYEKGPGNDSTYTLCATFKTDTTKTDYAYDVKLLPALLGMIKRDTAIYPPYGMSGNVSRHKSGKDCFELPTNYLSEPSFGDPKIVPDQPGTTIPMTDLRQY